MHFKSFLFIIPSAGSGGVSVALCVCPSTGNNARVVRNQGERSCCGHVREVVCEIPYRGRGGGARQVGRLCGLAEGVLAGVAVRNC